MSENKRQPKTPRQRAEEALGVAQRRVATLEAKLEKARGAVTDVEGELAEARRRLTYVTADPALPGEPEPEAVPDEDEAPA